MNEMWIEKATQITSHIVQADQGQDGSGMEGKGEHQQTSKILDRKKNKQNPNQTTPQKATHLDLFFFFFFLHRHQLVSGC